MTKDVASGETLIGEACVENNECVSGYCSESVCALPEISGVVRMWDTAPDDAGITKDIPLCSGDDNKCSFKAMGSDDFVSADSPESGFGIATMVPSVVGAQGFVTEDNRRVSTIYNLESMTDQKPMLTIETQETYSDALIKPVAPTPLAWIYPCEEQSIPLSTANCTDDLPACQMSFTIDCKEIDSYEFASYGAPGSVAPLTAMTLYKADALGPDIYQTKPLRLFAKYDDGTYRDVTANVSSYVGTEGLIAGDGSNAYEIADGKVTGLSEGTGNIEAHGFNDALLASVGLEVSVDSATPLHLHVVVPAKISLKKIDDVVDTNSSTVTAKVTNVIDSLDKYVAVYALAAFDENGDGLADSYQDVTELAEFSATDGVAMLDPVNDADVYAPNKIKAIGSADGFVTAVLGDLSSPATKVITDLGDSFINVRVVGGGVIPDGQPLKMAANSGDPSGAIRDDVYDNSEDLIIEICYGNANPENCVNIVENAANPDELMGTVFKYDDNNGALDQAVAADSSAFTFSIDAEGINLLSKEDEGNYPLSTLLINYAGTPRSLAIEQISMKPFILIPTSPMARMVSNYNGGKYFKQLTTQYNNVADKALTSLCQIGDQTAYQWARIWTYADFSDGVKQ